MSLLAVLAFLVVGIPYVELCHCDNEEKGLYLGQSVPKSLCVTPLIIEVEVQGVYDGPDEKMLDYRVQILNVLRGTLTNNVDQGSVFVPIAGPPCYDDFIMEKGKKFTLAVDTVGSDLVLSRCNFASSVEDLTSLERSAIKDGC